MSPISFFIEGDPTAWSRARRSGDRYFTAESQKAWQWRVLTAARRACDKAPPGPLEVVIAAVFRRPAARPAGFDAERWRTGERCARPADPDVDNVAKGILDALQLGVLPEQRWLSDDNRVVHLGVVKLYAARGEEPGTRVWVGTWDASRWVEPTAGET